jgi:hypothetical protein
VELVERLGEASYAMFGTPSRNPGPADTPPGERVQLSAPFTDIHVSDAGAAELRREVESLGQSVAVKPGRQKALFPAFARVEQLFSPSKLGISTETLRDLTPALVALLNSITYQ